jgi:hypothetical protein
LKSIHTLADSPLSVTRVEIIALRRQAPTAKSLRHDEDPAQFFLRSLPSKKTMGLKEDISQPQSYYWERLPAENPGRNAVFAQGTGQIKSLMA